MDYIPERGMLSDGGAVHLLVSLLREKDHQSGGFYSTSYKNQNIPPEFSSLKEAIPRQQSRKKSG